MVCRDVYVDPVLSPIAPSKATATRLLFLNELAADADVGGRLSHGFVSARTAEGIERAVAWMSAL